MVDSGWASTLNVTMTIATSTSKSAPFRPAMSENATTSLPEISLTNTKVFGLPRPVFVIITGTVIMSLLIATLCIYNLIASHRYHKHKYGGFQKVGGMSAASLFEDDEEDIRNNRFLNVREYADDPPSSDEEDELYNVKVWKSDEKDPIT